MCFIVRHRSESQDLRFGAWSESKYDKQTVISCLRKLDKVVAEGKKSTGAYFMDDEEASEYDYNQEDEFESENFPAFAAAADDDDDQYVYLEAQDLGDRIFEEDELKLILATYQEVRKAIQGRQKGRGFYQGGKGKSKNKNKDAKMRGSQWKDYVGGKRKVHIEQLKLRTRCAKFGAVGHWAKECRSGDGSFSSPAPSAPSTAGV